MTEESQLTPHRSCQMSSGLKERLKRCGRYHSSPVGGQGSQRRTQFTSPLLLSFEKSDRGKSPRVNKCGIQNIASSIENPDSGDLRKSLEIHSPDSSLNSPVLVNKEGLQTNDCGSLNAGLIKPQRLNFSQNQQGSEKKAFCSTGIISENNQPKEELQRSELQSQLKEREDMLRKLKLVQFYQHKHDLDEMEGLIRKWYQVCQEGLVDLRSLMPDPRPELMELINHLGIDHRMIGYDKDDESFTAYTE